jgi:flagellar motor switch/type III secretory pathway protein FliN
VQSDSRQPAIVPFEFKASDQNQSESAFASLNEIAGAFSRGLRRTLPFLARQRAQTVLGKAFAGTDDELPLAAEGPSFLIRLSSPEQVWVTLQFDSAAILALLDGLFNSAKPEPEEEAGGADEEQGNAPSLGAGLTLAQRALLKRLGGDLVGQLRPLVENHCQVKLGAPQFESAKSDESAELAADAVCIDCNVENVRRPWAIRLSMGAAGLQRLSAKDQAAMIEQPPFGEVALRIPVNVVAELGRVTLKLSQVLGLRVGDTLRLPSPANDPVLVRVEGVPKFDAVPVISRGQVAVKIHARHQE